MDIRASALWDLAEVSIPSIPATLVIIAPCTKPAYRRSLFRLQFTRGYPARGGRSAEFAKIDPLPSFLRITSRLAMSLRRCCSLGVKVPADVALVGFDDFRASGVDFSATYGRTPTRPGNGSGRDQPAIRAHRTGRITADWNTDRTASRNRVTPLLRMQASNRRTDELSSLRWV